MANSRKSPSLNKLSAEVKAQRALEAILARVVICAKDAVALGYSGGLDSSVLLHLALRFCAERGLKLCAFHVHHGLSPDADSWLLHCREQAQAYGVQFESRHVQLHHAAEHGTEQAARLARYAALAELCRLHHCRLLLTAHHQDDQAESVLLQLLRGAGLPGLSGMPQLHNEHALLGSEIALGRPLLECSRIELERYAEAQHLSFVVDASNTDPRYKRNALRQQLAPILETHFPGYAATLSRSARHMQTAQVLLDQLAEIDLQACAQGEALLLDAMRRLVPERRDNLLRYWLKLRGAEVALSEAQLAQIHQQLMHARSDSHPQCFVGGLCIQRQGELLLALQSAPLASAPSDEAPLVWRGEPEIELLDWQGILSFELSEDGGIDPAFLQAGPLSLRARSGGEKLKLDAKRPSRSLKQWFQEQELPFRTRPWLPLLYCAEQLVFAAGLGADVRVPQAQKGVRLHWRSLLPHVK